MDGLKSRGQVVVMAATNRPDDLDEAIRRPGRFDRELRINPPTEDGRRKILEIHSRNMPIEDKEAILTEFSNKTPLFDCNQLSDVGVALVLYPLSAFRAMSKAAELVYKSIAKNGHQKFVLDTMQTREELYTILGYHAYEQQLDSLFNDQY